MTSPVLGGASLRTRRVSIEDRRRSAQVLTPVMSTKLIRDCDTRFVGPGSRYYFPRAKKTCSRGACIPVQVARGFFCENDASNPALQAENHVLSVASGSGGGFVSTPLRYLASSYQCSRRFESRWGPPQSFFGIDFIKSFHDIEAR